MSSPQKKHRLILTANGEFGKCGIGDYTRLWAKELHRQGDDITVIAFHDKDFSGEGSSIDTEVEFIRWGHDISWKEKTQRLSAFLNMNPVDAISIQYSAFGFHPKGIALEFLSLCHSIQKTGIPIHVMMHELWLGLFSHYPLKHRILGIIQKLVILRTLRAFKGCFLTTQSKLYQKELKKAGLEAKLLPLFSNFQCSCKSKTSIKSIDLAETVTFCQFGNFYEERGREILEQFISKALKKGISIKVISLGRINDYTRDAFKLMMGLSDTGLEIEILEEVDEKTISEVMAESHIAINQTPLPFVDKSGVLALYGHHQMPVISCAFELNSNHKDRLSPALPITSSESFRFTDECLNSMYVYSPPTLEESVHLFKNIE